VIPTELTFRELVARFLTFRKGKARRTKETERSISVRLDSTFPRMDTPVSELTPADLSGWLDQLGEGWNAWREKEVAGTPAGAAKPKEDEDKRAERLRELLLWRATTRVRYRLFLSEMFAFGMTNRHIKTTPFIPKEIPNGKKQKIERHIPTEAEFLKIMASVRSQKHNRNRNKTGDFLEFVGRAGLGQAEVVGLLRENIDLGSGKMQIYRKKTKTYFPVPIYDWLRPVLERILEGALDKSPKARVFSILDGKKALTAASEALNLQHFSQRNLRAMLIKRLWKAGVDIKLIAQWQGHQDGGKLILSTYTEVFSSGDNEYDEAQLAKAAAYVPT
jgi:integrase